MAKGNIGDMQLQLNLSLSLSLNKMAIFEVIFLWKARGTWIFSQVPSSLQEENRLKLLIKIPLFMCAKLHLLSFFFSTLSLSLFQQNGNFWRDTLVESKGHLYLLTSTFKPSTGKLFKIVNKGSLFHGCKAPPLKFFLAVVPLWSCFQSHPEGLTD